MNFAVSWSWQKTNICARREVGLNNLITGFPIWLRPHPGRIEQTKHYLAHFMVTLTYSRLTKSSPSGSSPPDSKIVRT